MTGCCGCPETMQRLLCCGSVSAAEVWLEYMFCGSVDINVMCLYWGSEAVNVVAL